MNLAETLQIAAELMPEQPAVGLEGRRWTYDELSGRVGAHAAWLSAHGVQRGGTVATMQEFSQDFIALFYATLSIGARVAPLNTRIRAAELAGMLDDVKPDVVVFDERYAAVINAADAHAASGSGAVATARLVAELPGAGGGGLDPAEVDDDDEAVVLHTSGTTGRPKPVILRHGGLVSGLLRAANPPDGTPKGITVLAAPNHHVAGLSGLLNGLFSGRQVELLPAFSAAAWLRLVESSGAAHAFVVPTMLQRILADPAFGDADLSSLRVVAYGAAPMPGRVIRDALARFPRTCGFVGSYGQTETGGTVCVLGTEDHDAARDGAPAALTRLASIGRPLGGVAVTILDEAGQPLPPGTPGEIAVSFDEREPRWHRTGDLGHRDDGGYLFLSSRRDDLIIRGGENIDPAEIEEALATHPAVAEVAVAGLPDDEWGQVVAAFVVPAAGQPPTAQALVTHCKGALASFKAPAVVHMVKELPRTALGKVRRRELVDWAARQGKEIS